MKKLILAFICVMHAAFISVGCSVDLQNIALKSEDTDNLQEQETQIQNTIITAVENKDFEMFKSVYSDYALEKAADIEKGFEYICGLYSGSFKEFLHSNNSGGTEYFNESRGSIYNPSFGLQTDEKYYILRFTQWDFPEYPSMSGVHCVQLVECTKEDAEYVGGKSFVFPGVYYPENEFIDVIYGRIIHFLGQMEDGKGYGNEEYNVNIRESLSDELLTTADLDAKLIEVQNYFDCFSPSHIELAWYSGDLKQVYFRLDTYDSYIYLRLDDKKPEKIKLMQIVKIDGDKPVEEYDFESDCGIYLP